MRLPLRAKLPADLAPLAPLEKGERVLAWARGRGSGYVLATTLALHRLEPDGSAVVTPYVDVLTARWDPEQSALEVVEAPGGAATRRVLLALEEPGFVPETVRERVQASIVLSRPVAVRPRAGATVVARRRPDGRGPITWQVTYDPGVRADDPRVESLVAAALEELSSQLG